MIQKRTTLIPVIAVVAAGLLFPVHADDTPTAPPGAGSPGPSVVKNPYEGIDWGRVNQYLANFHSHTIYSDGRAEPEELIQIYEDAGYSILAITDHDTGYRVRDGERDVEPTHETTWPWSRWIDAEPSAVWTYNGMEGAAFYPDLGEQGMLAIRGNELSQHPHIVSLFNDCGYADRRQSDDERMTCVGTRGGLAYWAHPGLYVPPNRWQERVFDSSLKEAVEYFGDYLARYDTLLGIEFRQRGGDEADQDQAIFDALLKAHYKHHDIFIFGSDDNHSTTVRDDATLTIILAEELTAEAVRHAIKSGHTFVGIRSEVYPEFREITVDEAAKTISVDIPNIDGEAIEWIRNGEAHHRGATVDYSAMEDTVLRFQILNEAGRGFFSQAFHID